MDTHSPELRLSQTFLDRVTQIGLTDAAVAAAIGVTRQFYSQVKTGKAMPTARFMAGAVAAGLASSLDQVATLVEDDTAEVE
ncbi:MAG: helix-turn-helix transcriptional regulator [Actinomycetaceae bacterium]|nr:helix-turn-helix transcriptional regulator [Actinomycetaceae bacterium]